MKIKMVLNIGDKGSMEVEFEARNIKTAEDKIEKFLKISSDKTKEKKAGFNS